MTIHEDFLWENIANHIKLWFWNAIKFPFEIIFNQDFFFQSKETVVYHWKGKTIEVRFFSCLFWTSKLCSGVRWALLVILEEESTGQMGQMQGPKIWRCSGPRVPRTSESSCDARGPLGLYLVLLKEPCGARSQTQVCCMKWHVP